MPLVRSKARSCPRLDWYQTNFGSTFESNTMRFTRDGKRVA
jgi:hypothetical protein